MRVEETWNRDFEYEPVNSKAGDIRLLTILPKCLTVGVSKVACLLENANLNVAPRYTALSYTWGSPHNTDTILVNGIEFTVTVNLATLLTHLQSETREVTVWADAICIKQWDYDEKGLQIAQMLRVYQTARSTYIWLGPAEDGSEEAMEEILIASKDDKIRQLADRPLLSREMQAAEMLYEYPSRLTRHIRGPASGISKHALKLPFYEDKEKLEKSEAAFVKLMNRHYWSRVWCMQEIVVSGDARVSCGSHSIDAESFSLATRAHSRHLALRSMDASGRISAETQGYAAAREHLEHTMASRMLQQRQRYINGTALGEDNRGHLKLAHLLSVLYVDDGIGSTSPLQSGDPRDRIYGMLGMAEDTQHLGIVPNYNIAWEAAYTDVMFKLLKNGHSNTLLLCQNRSEQPASLPSWVPNFQQSLRQPPSQPPSLKKPFNVCGSSRNMAVGHNEGSTMLRIRGMVLSTVTEVKEPASFAEAQIMDASFQQIHDFLANIGFLVDKSREHNKENTIARVAVGDLEHHHNKDTWSRATTKTQDYYRLALPALKALASGKEIWHKRKTAASNVKERLPTAAKLGGAVAALTGGIAGMAMFLPKVGPYVTAVMRMSGRRPFLAADGRVGLGPGDMRAGDSLVLFDGVDVPMVLRSVEDDRTFQLVGEAYVHGVMDGEMVNESTLKRFFDLI